MRRRQFIAGIGGTAAWPPVARAQQRDRMRRVGVPMPYIERDTDARLSYFVQGLAQFGWIGGRNLRMDVRWAAGKLEQLLMYANGDVAGGSGAQQSRAVQLDPAAVPYVTPDQFKWRAPTAKSRSIRPFFTAIRDSQDFISSSTSPSLGSLATRTITRTTGSKP